MMREGPAFVITTSFSTSARHVGMAATLDDRAQQTALLVLVAALENAGERRIELRERHLGQEAQAAEVDAEHRDRPLEQAARREQRPVAAEHDERVRLRCSLAARGDRAAGVRLPSREGRGRLVGVDPHAARAQPFAELPDDRARLREVGPREDADRVHGKTAFPTTARSSSPDSAGAPGTRRRKNSRLPSAPGTGDGHAPRTP